MTTDPIPTSSLRKSTQMEWKFASHRPLTLNEANSKLRENATTCSVGGGDTPGIRTDTVRVASVTPVEDDLSYGEIDVGRMKKWPFWGVYDGHSSVYPPALARRSTNTVPGAGLLPQSCASPSPTMSLENSKTSPNPHPRVIRTPYKRPSPRHSPRHSPNSTTRYSPTLSPPYATPCPMRKPCAG